MNKQKITTTVKRLNGDLFTVEHIPDSKDYGLKRAIQDIIPEFYTECQILTYPDPENKQFVYVMVDTIENAVTIELKHEYNIIVHDQFEKKKYKCSNVNLYWSSIYEQSKHGYGISIIYHPQKGLTSNCMMEDEYTESFNDGENEEEYQRSYFVRNERKMENIWFPTFRQLLSHLDLKNTPQIYSSDDFLDRVDQAFESFTI